MPIAHNSTSHDLDTNIHVVPLDISDILNCRLDEKTMSLCIKLMERNAVDSTALAFLIAELQRSLPPKL